MACSNATSHRAAPLVVCGTTLSDAAAGPALEDVSTGAVTVRHISVDTNIYLKLSANCHSGASATVVPPTAASIISQARTDDGASAAVVLHPHVEQFDVRVRRPNGAVDLVRVRLDGIR